jgi:hypothetical protein
MKLREGTATLRSPTLCEKSLHVPTPRGWDGEFESISLQRRVSREPDFIDSDEGAIILAVYRKPNVLHSTGYARK